MVLLIRNCVCYGCAARIRNCLSYEYRSLFMSLVITGAGGHLGRRAAEHLLDQVDPARVVLLTRRPGDLADLAARGATVRFADFAEPATLDAAFAGAERVLLISTDVVGARVAGHRAAIDAAVRMGARHIAYTSVPNPAPGTSPVADDHRATEEAIRASGVACTFLRNALYAEYRVAEAQAAIEHGAFHHNLGEGRTAYVSREDCAVAGAAVLAGGAGHEGKVYDITGPELLGAGDLARIYGELGGTMVEAIAVDDAAFAAALPEPVAALLTAFGRAIREGHLDQRSDAVAGLTGRPATPLADVLSSALARA
jgi:NAD(P)H dehydrogenase (quinone)